MFWDVARWWAAEGDVVLHLPTDGSLRGATFHPLAPGAEAIAAGAFDWSRVSAIEPWGWDRHICGVMRRLGAPERLLPTDACLDRLRELSSRRTAVSVLRVLADMRLSESVAGIVKAESRWCTTEEAVADAVAAYGGRAMLKQPWSCSGRGVWRSDGATSAGRISKTLRQQGAVEVEPLYERIADFAMEFCADGSGHVVYEGLSYFATRDGGAYAGNVVAPQEELRRRIEALLPAGGFLPEQGGDVAQPSSAAAARTLPLEALAAALCDALASILQCDYSGPLGVDMMLTPQGVHPCIEVNLRNTMGRVAIFEQRAREAAPVAPSLI